VLLLAKPNHVSPEFFEDCPTESLRKPTVGGLQRNIPLANVKNKTKHKTKQNKTKQNKTKNKTKTKTKNEDKSATSFARWIGVDYTH
jgi:hypothetical protein